MRALILIAGLAAVATAQQKEFTDWPARCLTARGRQEAEDSTWYAALEFAKVTEDQALTDALVKRFAPWSTEEGQQKLISWERHVDHNIFGIVPLELYIRTKDPKYLELGKKLAGRQWEKPTPGEEVAIRTPVEDKANASEVIDTLKHEISGLIAVNPGGGKIAGAHAVSAVVESGSVFLPHLMSAFSVGLHASPSSTSAIGFYYISINSLSSRGLERELERVCIRKGSSRATGGAALSSAAPPLLQRSLCAG